MLLTKNLLWSCPLNIAVIIIANICIVLLNLAIWFVIQEDSYTELITINGVESSTMSYIELLAVLILIVVNFLLIIGVIKRQQKLIILWLVVLAAYIILIGTIILFAAFLPNRDFIDLNKSVGLCLIIAIVIFSYFWYWVYNYYEELNKPIISIYNVIPSEKS